jgi:beta-phosphoglucomutase-like phosphatase (HAD superfamily)
MVVALAAMAAAALVQAMVTDGWDGVRHKVARLFGRGQPDVAIERRLDATRDQLTGAMPGDVETMQAALAAQWETRFADLLADHPDAVPELAALVKEIKPTVTAKDYSVAAGGNVTATARDGGVAANVIRGDVHTGPTKPGPESS